MQQKKHVFDWLLLVCIPRLQYWLENCTLLSCSGAEFDYPSTKHPILLRSDRFWYNAMGKKAVQDAGLATDSVTILPINSATEYTNIYFLKLSLLSVHCIVLMFRARCKLQSLSLSLFHLWFSPRRQIRRQPILPWPTWPIKLVNS